MMVMKTATRCLILCLLAIGLSACDSSPLLRDDYMGQSLIEPDLLAQRVPRDRDGNPMLQNQSWDLEGFWPKMKVW